LSFRRRKIGADPNNTQWAKATDRFGHKILTLQGWKPGDTLGAENASHASHYTSASSSHIRVLLREDGLGLGAKNGRQEADKFGLDMFQGLLGRLNGKSEEVLEKEAGYRRDLRLKEMVVKRFGGTTFVSGGYLVGDKIEKEAPSELVQADVIAVKEKKSKKRKRSEEADEAEAKANKSSAKIGAKEGESSAEEVLSKEERRRLKKDKKRKQREAESSAATEAEAKKDIEPVSGEDTPADLNKGELKKQRKAERRAAKEARRQERQERKRKRREDDHKEEAVTSILTTPVDSSETDAPSDLSVSTLQKTPAVPRGRFAVRSRYSQQKRLAASDQQALKEIFMIKAGA
jgi:Pin2-interacting protein X1